LPGDDAPLNDAGEIRQRLEGLLDLIIDGGACPREPTTVIDIEVDPPRLERQGRGDLARLGL
jgi:tRNA A37 threonylcarbamoyladenosine synthetase subunit TsaC/SUA5/YrdC